MALLLCALLFSTQAYACRTSAFMENLFFETIPDPQPDANLIAKVTLLDVSHKGIVTVAKVEVLQVLKATNTRIRQGSIIFMKFMVSSCGPSGRNGDEGIIIAKAADADREGRIVFYPYTYRYYDGLVSAPSCPRIKSWAESCVHD